MKYLSAVILLSCSIFTLSSALAEDPRCNGVVDVVTGLDCGVHEAKVAVAPTIHTATIHFEAGGSVALEVGHAVVEHLQAVGKSLGGPWKKDFTNLEEEPNQDVAHAAEDFGKATGQTAAKVGKGIWRGLKAIKGGVNDVAVVVINDENGGFANHPEDIAGALGDTYKGTKNVFVDMGGGIYKVFKLIKGRYAAKLDYIKTEDGINALAKAQKGLDLETSSPELTTMIPEQAADNSEPKPMEAASSSASDANRALAGYFTDRRYRAGAIDQRSP